MGLLGLLEFDKQAGQASPLAKKFKPRRIKSAPSSLKGSSDLQKVLKKGSFSQRGLADMGKITYENKKDKDRN